MKITVQEVPTATWRQDGDAFFCEHDGGVNEEEVEMDTMRDGEHDTYTTQVAICADPSCAEVLTNYVFGDPNED